MLKSIQQSLILAAGLMVPVMTFGAIRGEDEAKQVAAEFFQSGESLRLAKSGALELVHVAKDGVTPVCYVFNAKEGKGFVIVSADTDAMPVIGYSDNSIWNPQAMPEAAGSMISSKVEKETSGRRIFRAGRAAQTQKVLTTPSWSQEAPFNNNIPGRRLTGCVGTAVAEIMKYHQFPAQRPASLINLGESTDYAWDQMRNDNYRTGYSVEEGDAVATLVADAAIAIGTNFGASASSAYEVYVPYALSSMFGYDAGISYKKREELDKNTWDNILVDEIDADRPVLYCGNDVYAGHAFVCDGYEMRGDSPYFHINWGWGGSANGYYASNALNPVVSKAHSYNDLMTIVYNIKPAASDYQWSPIRITSDFRQPGLTLSIREISAGSNFTVRAGTVKNISTQDFNGRICVALFGADGKMKSLLADERACNLGSMYYWQILDFNCRVPADVNVESGDVVRLITQEGVANQWLPVMGDGLAPGEAKAKGGELSFYRVEIPDWVDDDIYIDGISRVIKGRDYVFTVECFSPSKVVTVKANGFILTPESNNRYRISNVLEDVVVTVNVQNAADVLNKASIWIQAGQLQNAFTENEVSTIKDLTLFGTMNVDDFSYIRERMKLERLDISQVNIVASGSSPANAVPTKALLNYRSLKQIFLPNNVNTFKNGCLAGTGLTEIEIPASVGTYEYNVFANCRSLQKVIVRRSSVAWVNWCVFTGTPQTTLVVPVGASYAYKNKEYWQDFKEIIEENPETPSFYSLALQEKRGVKFNPITKGNRFEPGTEYSFTLETEDIFGDAVLQIYGNSTPLTADANGVYKYRVNSNTLIHVVTKKPEPTTTDIAWKIRNIGMITDVINVPVNKNFTVRVNSFKFPPGDHSFKYYALVLTDKDGGIKEFISQIDNSSWLKPIDQQMNFTCMVKDASVREGNEIRLATSFNKKVWNLVVGEDETVKDRIPAVGNQVIYHHITMPSNVSGAKIDGAKDEVVHGMPYSFKVSAINPAQRVTVAVNGKTVVLKQPVANVNFEEVLEDLDVTVSVADAEASDYTIINVQEGLLASKLEECPERLKLMGTMSVNDFNALRNHAQDIIDLDLSEVTIKGAAMTGNSIPENAFAPSNASHISALKTVILPKNLERFTKNAFARCTQISEITIPAGVTYIGDAAFSQCTSLKKIIALPKVAPVCGNMSPWPSNPGSITLEVPSRSEESYSVPSTWWTKLNLYKAPTEKIDTYALSFDKGRFGIASNYKDLSKIEVRGEKETRFSLSLPNCQQPGTYKATNILRLGVPFKVYDNGVDIFNNMNNYICEDDNNSRPEQYWSQTGGRLTIRWIPNATSGPWVPQDHLLELYFYYNLSFEAKDGANGVMGKIEEVPEGCEWKNVTMRYFLYNSPTASWQVNSEIKPVLYKEGSQVKFSLTNVAPKTDYEVKAITKVMTKAGSSPVYEEREEILVADNGIYTTPKMDGDTRIVITGTTRFEEGDPVPADQLTTINEDDAVEFTELIVTGEMDDTAFETIRDNFEGVESLDLSQIENTSIPEGAFEGMDHLKNVIIPVTVTEIGEGAFKDCEGLESITLPGVSTIGEGAFEGCTNLTSILIPSAEASSDNPADAPLKRSARSGHGVTAESFRGLNPNCLIYVGGEDIPFAEELNIILNKGGKRVAASDIIIDSNYPFNAPASFGLDTHRISFTAHIPGSIGNDENGGWSGIMLPFTPTKWEYGVEFPEREGSGLTIVSFSDGNAENMTVQSKFEANHPYLANVSAPYVSVPVTFYAESASTDDEFVYDVPVTPVPEETVAVGKDFSLYGSYDGETTLGICYGMNETADCFVRPADDEKPVVGAFGAYLRANDGVEADSHVIGEHNLWICEPQGAGVNGTQLYRSQKIELMSPTQVAQIYYTTDGSDPTDEASERKLYEGGFNMDTEALDMKAVAVYKGKTSEVVDLKFELKKAAVDFDLSKNWNWISHNIESPLATADFADSGISRILGQETELVRDPQFGLVGNLKVLDPAVAYKVCVSDESWKHNVAGIAFDPSTVITLRKGWNWIGSPIDSSSTLIADLFSGLELEEGDMLVGLDGFTQVNAEGEWQGTLDRLIPGVGYMFFCNSDKEFTYALLPVSEETADRMAAPSETPWAIDIHAYPSVMPLTATLLDASADDYVIGAFCGDECRGIGVMVGNALMFNIHGQRGDVITFRFIDGNNTLVSDAAINFNESPVGTFSDPYELHISGTTALKTVNGVENYVVVGDKGMISVEGDLSKVLSIEVFDMSGHKLANAVKTTKDLRVSDLESGLYIILVRTTEGDSYRKIRVK